VVSENRQQEKSSTATNAKARNPRFSLQHSLKSYSGQAPDVTDKNRDLNHE